MSTQSLSEQVKSDVQSLLSSLRDLQSLVRLADIRDNVEDLQSSVRGMSQRIESLRNQGYVFEKDLEEKAANFLSRLEKLEPNLKARIERESNILRNALNPLSREITQLAAKSGSPAMLRPLASKLKSRVETLKGQVDAAERSIRGEYDQFSADVQKIKSHLTQVEQMLKKFDEATFELLATEAGIMAVKAVWAKNGKERKDDPEGVLYLTDQRILFEQKEEVATKKVLFVTTEKKLVQDLLWEAPVALIEEVEARNEGFMNKDDFIDVHFGDGAPFDSAHLHIWQSSDDWKIMLRQAKAKEFDATRAIPIDKEAAKKVKNAPTECASCGGAIAQVVLRGMESITCEFCGAVIRL